MSLKNKGNTMKKVIALALISIATGAAVKADKLIFHNHTDKTLTLMVEKIPFSTVSERPVTFVDVTKQPKTTTKTVDVKAMGIQTYETKDQIERIMLERRVNDKILRPATLLFRDKNNEPIITKYRRGDQKRGSIRKLWDPDTRKYSQKVEITIHYPNIPIAKKPKRKSQKRKSTHIDEEDPYLLRRRTIEMERQRTSEEYEEALKRQTLEMKEPISYN